MMIRHRGIKDNEKDNVIKRTKPACPHPDKNLKKKENNKKKYAESDYFIIIKLRCMLI